MLLTCSSCNSRYLVNSLDLKPNGRNVQCAVCYNEWFQEPNLDEKETLESSVTRAFKDKDNELEQKIYPTSNLPSTYIEEAKPSIISSILVILLVFLITIIFWFIKKESAGLKALLNFYIQEFYFNLKLIISDLVLLILQVLN